MTSLKSLKYKNISPFAFRDALRSGILPFLIFFAFMTFICPVVNFVNLLDEHKGLHMREQYENITNLNQKYVYSVLQEANDASIFITFATLAVSVIMGISMFRFIISKKTVNVYYSLGITRTKLFIARYSAGLTLLLIAIAVPVAISCLINIGFIGYSAAMLTSAAYITLSIFSLAVLTFSVTSAVMSAVGTSIEGFSFTTMIMLIPTGIFYMVELLTQTMLYGNPYKGGYHYYGTLNYEDMSLLFRFSKFNPIMYLYTIFEDDAVGQLRHSQAAILAENKLTSADYMSPGVAIIWLIIGFAAAGLGLYLFNKRKAEICGFFGMNKTLNFVTMLVAGLAVFTISTGWLYWQYKAVSIIVTLIAVLVSYLIISLIFTRSIKKTIRNIYMLGAEYIAVIIVFTIFATGGFGYSARMPKLTEIKSADISTVAYETLLTKDECNVWKYYSDEYSAFSDCLNDSTLGPYTSTDDIQKILQIHSKLIQLGSADKENLFNTNIVIHYTLADGSDFCRYYEYADLEALRMNLKLYDTDFYKEELEKNYSAEVDGFYSEDDDMMPYSVTMYYDDTRIIAVGSSVKSDSFRYIDGINEKQFNELKQAIANDLKSLSSEQYYTPEKPAIGAIVFRNKQTLNDYNYEGELELSEDKLSERVFYTEDIAAESTVFLTPDMVQTLAFLEQNRLMSYFTAPSADDVTDISFLLAVVDRYNYLYQSGTEFTLDFFAENEVKRIHYSDTTDSELAHQNTITDKQQIAEILKLSHMKYYTANSGYICRITYKNGEIVRKYISAEDAPDFVKNYEYNIGSDETHSSVYSDIAIIGGADGPVEMVVAEIQ